MDENVTETRYMCDLCEAEGFSFAEMRDHMMEHTSVPTCPFCDLADVTEEEMTLHVNSVHLSKSQSEPKKNYNKSGRQVAEGVKDTSRVGVSKQCSSLNGSADSEPVQCSKGKLFVDTLQNIHSEEREGIVDVSRSNVGNVSNSLSCPICSYETDCADVLLVHINQAHFQDTPEKNSSVRKGDSVAGNKGQEKKSYGTCKERLVESEADVGSNEAAGISQLGNCDIEMVSELQKDRESHGSDDINRTPSKEGKLSCPFCDTEYEQSISLEFHMRGSHENELQEVEPLDFNVGDSVSICPVCEEKFPQTELSLLEAHVNSHFTASSSPADSLQSQEKKRREEQAVKFKAQKNKGASSNSSKENVYKKQGLKNLESAVARGQMSITDFYNSKQELVHANKTGVDEGVSCTKDIIPRLQQFLHKQSGRYLMRYWLASPTDHYAGSYGDRGWGCGYRNLQMLLSYLMKLSVFQQPVFNGVLKIPSIPKLQQLIEAAWSQGYDPQGRQTLKNLLHTNKWIGATEICALLSSLGIKCRLLDFHSPTGPGNTHPRLFEWVKDFYSGNKEFKPPLYFQHQGHSRTIVGIEEYKDGSLKLLIFDPGSPKSQMNRFSTGDIDNNKMKVLRRTLNGIKAKQYQIVAIQGLLTSAEQERSKLLKSERIP